MKSFLLALVAAATITAAPVHAADSLLSTPGAVKGAIDAIVARMEPPRPVLRIEIGRDKIVLRAQGTRAQDVDEWSYSLRNLWLFTHRYVSGPRPLRNDGVVADVTTGFFNLADVPLAEVEAIGRQAIERAGLDDRAEVSSITIERRISVIPTPSYGDVHWSIQVNSERERATVYADAKGQVIGADLSQTNRAKRVDMIRDDWQLPNAARDIAAVVGPGEVMHEVWFYNSYISVKAEHPTDKKQLRGYSWDLGGVKRGLVDSPNLLSQHGLGDIAPFAFSEVDFSVLTALKEEARRQLNIPNGRITILRAQKPTDGVGAPQLEWTVEITGSSGEKGRVRADRTGRITAVVLPEGRRPAVAWSAPATVRATLDRIRREFGDQIKFDEISINDRNTTITAEDPRTPGAVAGFILDHTGFRRTGRPFLSEIGPRRAFTLAEVDAFDVERLADLSKRVVERVKLQGGEIGRFTFSRGVMTRSPRGLLVVEIRVEKNQGWQGGRASYEPDGTEIDFVAP